MTDETPPAVLDTVMVPIGDLRPHPRNYRKHPRAQLDHLKQSMRESGVYRNLVCARDLTILAGHGVHEAATELAVPELRCVVLDVDPSDVRALKILAADNELGRLAVVDLPGLADILSTVAEHDLSGLLGTAWDGPDLASLLASSAGTPETRTDPDEVPDPPAVPVTQPGDMWVLGDHLVLCGDCTDPAVTERALEKGLPGAVVTDPPYGVAIGAKNRALDAIDRAERALDDLEGDQGIAEVEALWRASFTVISKAIPPGCPYYVFGPQGGDLGLLLLLLLRDSGLSPRHILIWVKNRPSFSIGRLDYDYQHEPIVYGWKPGGPHPWHADGSRSSVIECDRPRKSPDHPTVKPVALLRQLIENSTSPGGRVFDPFGGSGSTTIAAYDCGRRSTLIELKPVYVDVICRRFQAHTGVVPVLESTGAPVDFTATD